MQAMTKDTLKALAAANGLTIPDARLDLVLTEYESLLRAIAELDTLPLSREAEPANVLSLLSPPIASDGRR